MNDTAAGPQNDKLDLVYYCLLDEARKIDARQVDLEVSGDVDALEVWEYEQDQALYSRCKVSVV